MSTTNGILVLSNGVGYGIVVGIGAFFALLMYLSPFLTPPPSHLFNSPKASNNTSTKSLHNLLNTPG